MATGTAGSPRSRFGFIGLSRATIGSLVAMLVTIASAVAEDRGIDRGIDRLRADTPSYRKQWALVAGINYDQGAGATNISLGRLSTAESDARAVADVLRRYYGYEVKELIGRDATRKTIEEAIDEFLCHRTDVTNRDSAIFYFAGHAWREQTVNADDSHVGFLCPVDVESDKGDSMEIARTSCVTMNYVLHQLDELCKARHRLLILDCCHAGEVFNVPRRRGTDIDKGFRADLFKNRSFFAMAAARDSESARDQTIGSEGHSPFTACLLKSLERGPTHGSEAPLRLFTASQLFRDVSLRFDTLRKETPGAEMAQDPQGFSINGNGQLYFFRTELTDADLLPDEKSAWESARRAERSSDPRRLLYGWVWMVVPAAAVCLALIFYRLKARPRLAMIRAGRRQDALSESESGTRFAQWAMIVLLSVHLGSLATAYYAPWSTVAWRGRFDQLGDPERWPRGVGFAIEACRSVIAIWLVTVICCHKFNDAFFRFVSPRYHTWRVNGARAAYLAVAIYFSLHETFRHLDPDLAPRRLNEWAAERGLPSTAQSEWYPYASYLPYSLVSYMVLMPMVAIIPLYAFTRDVRKVRHQQQAFADAASGSASEEASIIRKFEEFAAFCHRTCARYVDVLALVAWAIHFEYWVGSLTLTKEAFGLMVFAWMLVALTAAIVAWIAYAYGAGLEHAELGLVRVGCRQVTNELQQRSPFAFVKRILFGRMSGIVVLSLAVPFAHYVLTHTK